ncbi:MAG TPA: ATP-binding protein [Gemmatimonadaceae bacterium]|nr:ATP-binding protein [Gemmatimonadaceae bacterium]
MKIQNLVFRYVFAAACTAIATGITVMAQPFLRQTVLAVFLASLILVAWYGGRGPAILALVASAVVADVLFIPPEGALGFRSPADAVPLVVLLLLGSLIAFVSHRARSNEWQLRVQAAELMEQAVELEQQMESTQTLQLELELINDQMESANRELERSREFLEQAQRSARLGSWEWDIGSDEVTWSDELFRIYGLEPRSAPVTFDTFTEFLHPDDREMVTRTLQASLKSREAFRFDHRIVLHDGTVRWLDGRGRVICDGSGKPIRLVGSGQDITERRRAAEAQRFLAEAGATLGASLDYTATLGTVANLAVRELADWCSIAIGDSSGRYENIAVAHRNPERVKWAEEWTKAHPPRYDAPSGTSNVLRTGEPEVYSRIPPEMLRAAVESEEELRALETLGLYSAMAVPMKARGRTLGVITFISAESRREFTSDDLWLAQRLAGRAAFAVDNARLYEEARQAQQLAEQANRAKMDFLAAMSHEFRTPLNAIAGYAQLLELGVHGELSGDQRKFLERLQRSQRHLLGLVEEVLSFARIESGIVRYDVSEVTVGEIVARATEMALPQMQAKRLDFVSEPENAELRVLADGNRVEQILVNLLSNAVKFTEDGGSITVVCGQEDGQVVVTVTDTGIGIPTDKLETVFEPFAQLPHAGSRRSSGVGLGLAISRDLARAMGGDITVVSTVGAGSAFTLKLPGA